MCSEGVSVWFACKLCKSFFLNADDFAYHKKKSHVQEFQNTKFIVFEEQTTPTASPPENWVSFLSPKEETLVHKIISFPSSATTTNFGCKPLIENAQSNRNDELFEIDLDNKLVNDQDGKSEGAYQVSYNSFELNCAFNLNDDDNQALDTRNTDIPYVCLTRLKSSSSASVEEITQKTKVEPEICLTNEYQISATNLPLAKNLDDFCIADCKTDFNHDAWEENIDETHNSLRKMPRDPLSSESIPPDLATLQTTSNLVLLMCRFCSKKIKSGTFQTHVQFCKNLHSNQNQNQNQQSNLFTNQNPVSDPNTEANFSYGDFLNLVVKTEYAEETEDSELTETGTDIDPLESESHVEFSARKKSHHVAATSSNTSVKSRKKQASRTDSSQHCVSCKKQFASIRELKCHNRDHHGTLDGKPNFQCPHSNCGKTSTNNADLKKHIKQVHSLARPFKCLHPNCTRSFKTKFVRNRHSRRFHSS